MKCQQFVLMGSKNFSLSVYLCSQSNAIEMKLWHTKSTYFQTFIHNIKYNCTADLLFGVSGFDQISKSVSF